MPRWQTPTLPVKAPVKAPVKTRQTVAVRRPVRARYDAAQNGADNRRHWANSDALDAVRANSSAVRARLRNRARYEIDNNSYAKGITLTLANDTIGTGPRLQMLTDDPLLNDAIEREWMIWGKSRKLAAKLRTMKLSKTGPGEAFGLMFSNTSKPSLITLDMRLVDADQIDTPPTTEGFTDGIKFDEFGEPTEYALLNSHPGGLSASAGFTAIPAAHMLHWFRHDRPGQIRGISELTAALNLFALLRRYTLAVVTSSEMAAEFTMFLKTNGPPGEDADKIEDDSFTEVDIERNLMTTLPEGWDISQLKPEQPITTYSEFQKSILNEVARCLNMPFNVAAGNSEGYNYASGRLDHQVYFKSIDVEQEDCESNVLDPLLAAFLAEGSLTFGWKLPITDHQWFWPGREHVDPAKEAIAQKLRLENMTTTLAAEYARQGKDWKTQVAQIAAERKMIREMGLTLEDVEPNPPLEPAVVKEIVDEE